MQGGPQGAPRRGVGATQDRHAHAGERARLLYESRRAICPSDGVPFTGFRPGFSKGRGIDFKKGRFISFVMVTSFIVSALAGLLHYLPFDRLRVSAESLPFLAGRICFLFGDL